MKNLLILLGILLSSPFVVAQHLAINGNVAIANNSPEGTRVVVIKNGNKLDEQVLNKKGHFDLKLAFDADYKISFEKTGYITKIISINTEVPEESIENNPDFPPVKLIINLLPSVEKIDLSIFDQPIAILTYQAELDDFTFDKSYSDKIKDRIAQTEQAVKKQLAEIEVDALTLGDQSLIECISKKTWYNPLPKVRNGNLPNYSIKDWNRSAGKPGRQPSTAGPWLKI